MCDLLFQSEIITPWRLDSTADPAISSGMEKINEIMHVINDLERVQLKVQQNNDSITLLRVSKSVAT